MKEELIKIASSRTIEGLEKLINEFYYSTTFKITDNKVYNKNGLVESGRITKKKGRIIYSVLK